MPGSQTRLHERACDCPSMATRHSKQIPIPHSGARGSPVTERRNTTEPAIAMAYAMLQREDPVAPARSLLGGYLAHAPLAPEELDVLADLIEMRLVVSVTISAYERTRHPDNAYLYVTEPHAWRLLDWFRAADREQVARAFREVPIRSGRR